MKYTPKQPEENYNIGKQAPLSEAFQLVAGVALMCVGAYFLLGLLVDLGAGYIPYRFEDSLGSLHESIFEEAVGDSRKEDLQTLVSKLASNVADRSGYPDDWFQVTIVNNEQANAFATPGGKIFVFSGLLNYAKSEQELAMILGHEIGHLTNRDPVRLFGRNLFLIFMAMFVGSDNYAAELYQTSLSAAGASFSREQERSADESGIELVYKVFGHVGGVEDFFLRIQDDEDYASNLPEFASTHPVHENRVKFLRQLMIDKKYPTRKPSANPFKTKHVGLESVK